MEKKVLVIPSDDNELNDLIEEIWDRTNKDTARDFIRSRALPGNLKPLRETLVQAKAWKIAIRDNWLAHSGIEGLLAQARAKIEAEEKEKGDKGHE